MTYKVFDFFPLSVFKDKIILKSDEKKIINDFIFSTEKDSDHTNKRKQDAWLGDTKGQEFLFKNSNFKNLAKLIGDKIKTYTTILNIDNEQINFFYQRSWATITRTEERIHQHSHDQSNISFAYYPLKPAKSGNIKFFVQPQNEIAAGLFHYEKLKLGLLKEVNVRNAPSIDLHVEEDDIVIFPSKTKHATTPNKTKNPRISISGDITIMLKDSFGHERLMPHYNNWQSF